MWRGLLTWMCTMAMVGNTVAQEQAGQAKYEIIRETINFLATDKTVSKDTSFRISCETLDYDCFKQQLASEPIAGIDRWYNAWRAMKATDEADVTALRKQIFADIFDRPGKGYRKQLANYQTYVARTESLMHLPSGEVPPGQIPMEGAEEPVAHPSASNIIYPEETNEELESPENENTMIAYLALALALIALMPMLKKKEQQPATDFYALQGRLDELTIQLRRLEQKLPDGQLKEEVLTSLTEIMESVEKRVVALENRG